MTDDAPATQAITTLREEVTFVDKKVNIVNIMIMLRKENYGLEM